MPFRTDKLSEHERIDYLFARALRGRDYALEIVNAIIGLPVPSAHAINEALRMAHRAVAAREELFRLNPEPAA